MVRVLLVLLAVLQTVGCYAAGDDDDNDVSDDSDGGPPDDVPGDSDGGPPDVPLDDTPATSEGDIDGDGISNDVDTDDDGDGIPDDVDVDADGDGVLEESPSADAIAAAWALAAASCEEAINCCSMVLNPEDLGFSNWVEFRPVCYPDHFIEALPGFAQAVATAGAAIDQQAWQAEHGSASPDESGGLPECAGEPVDKGGAVRLPAVDELVLPYFHGTTGMGESCFTLWDCEADARCEALDTTSGAPGTCGLRPREGGSCGESEPYCPVALVCSITGEVSVCERPRNENDFCGVFELGGRTTDNCRAEQWCDATFVTPACRPVLREGDPCAEDRQCLSFECGADGCAPATDWWQTTQDLLHAWCPDVMPSRSN